jgi:hypothetical protein
MSSAAPDLSLLGDLLPGADSRDTPDRFLGVIRQKNLEEMAISLDVAVQGVLRDKYSRERELYKLLSEARNRSQRTDTPAAYFKRILALAHRVDGADYDPLLPFLQTCDELWPYSESVGPFEPAEPATVESTRELLMLAVSQGTMHEFFTPHAEVEQWVGGMAARIRAELNAWAADGGVINQHLLALLLGTAVALHDLMGGLAPYFQRVQDRTQKEYSFVAHVISEIRRALLWAVVRDLSIGTKSQAEADSFLAGLENVQRHRLKLYALPSRSEFQNVRFYLERLAADQDDLEDAFATLTSYDLLGDLASRLQKTPAFTAPAGESRTAEKVLPFGQVALIQSYEDDGTEQLLYYVVDGVGHETVIAHSCPDPDLAADAEMMPMLQPGCGFTLGNVLTCCVDDHNKVYFSPIDRLAPPPDDERYTAAKPIINRIDTACHRVLLEEWENYPDLFARLDTLGPLMLVRLGSEEYLVCRSECLRELQNLRGWTPQSNADTRALLERIHLEVEVPDTWMSLVLDRQDNPQPELPEGDPRRKWRALIRKRMERNRIPNFRRLVEKLAPFGVRVTTTGKGSHGTLLRSGREERKQTTWYALRHKADPLPINFVWECLERLGIGYQDFYQSLEEDGD